MTEQLAAIGGLYVLALIISAYLALAGPKRYQEAARWCFGTLATFGAGALAYLVFRGRTTERVSRHAPDTYHHAETDREVKDALETAAEVEEEIEATEARGYFEDGELGAEMRRRLEDDK